MSIHSPALFVSRLLRAVRFHFLGLALVASGVATAADAPSLNWIQPNQDVTLPASMEFDNFYGRLGVLNSSGAIRTQDHPFFVAMGSNGRACVSCHQPAYGMSVSASGLHERWRETQGKDPVFAAIDGSNCPHKPQELPSSHGLALERGLFRVMLPWPPHDEHGKPLKPEFDLEVVRDPTGCNTHSQFGLKSKTPTISVYRRPRPAANLKYVLANDSARVVLSRNGEVAAMDAATKLPHAMNLMSDARWPTLALQVQDAARSHLQTAGPLAGDQLQRLIEFQMQVYAAQVGGRLGGSLLGDDTPISLGPSNVAIGRPGLDGDNLRSPVFGSFAAWKQGSGSGEQREFRESVARGYDTFFLRPIWIRDTIQINTALGNPAKRTCSTCHAVHMTGQDAQAGWMDVGTTNSPWANESPELPLFKITCRPEIPSHPFLGRVIYTQDPGRALISGKCHDVGAIVIQQLRGLGARPPYFANGSAATLREVVDFYDRRFNIRFSENEKQDLVNFLSVL